MIVSSHTHNQTHLFLLTHLINKLKLHLQEDYLITLTHIETNQRSTRTTTSCGGYCFINIEKIIYIE